MSETLSRVLLRSVFDYEEAQFVLPLCKKEGTKSIYHPKNNCIIAESNNVGSE
jgi:hypothetical protein